MATEPTMMAAESILAGGKSILVAADSRSSVVDFRDSRGESVGCRGRGSSRSSVGPDAASCQAEISVTKALNAGDV